MKTLTNQTKENTQLILDRGRQYKQYKNERQKLKEEMPFYSRQSGNDNESMRRDGRELTV